MSACWPISEIFRAPLRFRHLSKTRRHNEAISCRERQEMGGYGGHCGWASPLSLGPVRRDKRTDRRSLLKRPQKWSVWYYVWWYQYGTMLEADMHPLKLKQQSTQAWKVTCTVHKVWRWRPWFDLKHAKKWGCLQIWTPSHGWSFFPLVHRP